MRRYFTTIRMAKIKLMPNTGKDAMKLDLSCIAGENGKWKKAQLLWKTVS